MTASRRWSFCTLILHSVHIDPLFLPYSVQYGNLWSAIFVLICVTAILSYHLVVLTRLATTTKIRDTARYYNTRGRLTSATTCHTFRCQELIGELLKGRREYAEPAAVPWGARGPLGGHGPYYDLGGREIGHNWESSPECSTLGGRQARPCVGRITITASGKTASKRSGVEEKAKWQFKSFISLQNM